MIAQKAFQTPARLRVPTKKGQTLVEYALVIAIISVVAIASMISMGGGVQTAFTTINRQMTTAQEGGQSGRH